MAINMRLLLHSLFGGKPWALKRDSARFGILVGVVMMTLPMQLPGQGYQTLTSDPFVRITFYPGTSKPGVSASYRGVSTLIGSPTINYSAAGDRVTVSYHNRVGNSFDNSIRYHDLTMEAELSREGQVAGLDPEGIPVFTGTIRSKIAKPGQSADWNETTFSAYTAFAELSHEGIRMIEVEEKGGNYNLELMTSQQNNHTWTITSQNDWIQVVGTNTGTGNRGVTIAVTENDHGPERVGFLEVYTEGSLATSPSARRGFMVVQAGQPASLTIDPEVADYEAGAVNERTIAVTSNVAWTASSSDAEWIIITGGESGSGPGAVTYRLMANASSASRHGTITISGGGLARTCAITQFGAGSVDPHNPFAAIERDQTGLIKNTYCGWLADDAYPWIWHFGHGWWYLVPVDGIGFWAYDCEPSLGWLYVDRSYPWIYSHGQGCFLWFFGAESGRRWFSKGDQVIAFPPLDPPPVEGDSVVGYLTPEKTHGYNGPSGFVPNAFAYRMYAFIAATETVTIDLESADFNAFLEVFGAHRWPYYGYDQDGGEGTNARFILEANIGETYLIYAGTSDFLDKGGTGTFTLSISAGTLQESDYVPYGNTPPGAPDWIADQVAFLDVWEHEGGRDVTDTLTAGDTALVQAVYRRNDDAVEPCLLHWFVDDVLVASLTVSTDRDGDTYSSTLRADWTATAGPHTLSVTLDPHNKIAETDETNNTFTRTFTVAPAP